MQKDMRLTAMDRTLGIMMNNCKKCKMTFHTLHREDEYCPFCEMEGFENPEPIKKRDRR